MKLKKLTTVSIIAGLTLFASALSGWAAPAARTVAAPGPEVHVAAATRYDTSRELRSTAPIAPQPGAPELENWPRLPSGFAAPDSDGALQSQLGANAMPTTQQNFDGLNNVNGIVPPDITGDVGPDHYVQWVNLSFQIFDKSGNSLYGPANGNTMWQDFPGACSSSNSGDPMVLYDHLANRWIMTQFALPNFPNGPFYQCLAVSASGDPLGAYHRYEFLISEIKFHDPPKFGVWGDGYYMTSNLLNQGTFTWAGPAVYAFDRAHMLNGQAATMQYVELPATDWGNLLPADLDGPAAPAGSPAYIVSVVDDGWDPAVTSDELHLHRFSVDWNNPANTSFNVEPVRVPVAAFDGVLCNMQRNCITQASSTRRLDAMSAGLMYRAQYRNFGSYETIVVNHTVNVGANTAGIRWYEMRGLSGTPTVHQQGTFAPSDGLHRWMGSAAMDSSGNIAIGYNASGASLDPSIRYTGRLAGDALGQMTQGEGTIVTGSGAQTNVNSRWGDYSTLALDPDGCTYWYMGEYIATTGAGTWQTRIASFRFPGCVSTPTAVQTSTVAAANAVDLSFYIVAFTLAAIAAMALVWRMRARLA